MDKNAPVSYVSADLYTPDRNISTLISVNTLDTDTGEYISSVESLSVNGSCDWVRRTIDELSTAEGPVERFKENYLPVYVYIWKTDKSALKAGDYILEGYFFGHMGDLCTVNLAGEDLDIVSWDEERVVLKCPSRMNSGMQKIILTDADGRSTRGAFSLTAPVASGITDTAMPLYDSTLPEIPFDVVGADETIVKAYGLLDTIYLLVSKHYSMPGNLQKLVGFSLRDKSWRVIATLPIRYLDESNVSMTAYQGALYVHGTDEKRKTHLICYVPEDGKWKEIAGQGIEGATLANFNNRLISIGGLDEQYAGKIRQIDVSTDPARSAVFMDLDTGFLAVHAANVGDTLYLYGGYASELEEIDYTEWNPKVFCYTVNGQASFRDRDKETDIHDSTASEVQRRYGKICASDREVYLVGAYMKDGISGSVTDPSGYRISEGDTWVLTNPIQNLGKRLSHTLVRDPSAAVYKGVLYGFGVNTQDGDPLKYVARATVVDQNPDYPVQDITKVKIPAARQGLKYNGKVQSGVSESKDGSYTVKGNKKTEPGTYKAVVSLTDTERFMWEDGTTDPKTVTWSIGTVPVTGVKAGTVKVTVTTKDGSKKASCTVKVITGVPVYRLYNIKGNGDHLFTTSAFEKFVLSVRGWKYEGIGFYALKMN